jgi:hypothetical protein
VTRANAVAGHLAAICFSDGGAGFADDVEH